MDALKALDEAFSRLVFDRAARDRVAAGDWDSLGLDDATRRALDGIDLDELTRLGRAVRRGIETGSLGGTGVRPSFPASLARLAGDGSEDTVLDRFLSSPQLSEVDAVGLRSGVSAVEAFYMWAADELRDDPAAETELQHEFAAAIMTTLTRAAVPGFQVRTWLVRHAAEGRLCLLDARRPVRGPDDRPDQPVLYAAASGRYTYGKVPIPVAAIVLSGTRDCPAWAAQLLTGLDPAQIDAVRARLAKQGLT